MNATRFLRAAFTPLVLLSGFAYVTMAGPDEAEVILLPHLVKDVYAPVETVGQLTVYYPGEGQVRLEGITLEVDGVEIADEALDLELEGNRDYGRLNALAESLPGGLAHIHRAPAFLEFFERADHRLSYDDRLREIRELVVKTRERQARGETPSFTQPVFPVFLDQVFTGDEVPGTTALARINLRWRSPQGQVRVDSTTVPLTWHGSRPGVPDTFAAGNSGAAVHVGDLHVHSCAGEAVGACAPYGNCAAESLQTSGSFTYAQLVTQFQALGMDWFTATDHSYCINSGSEWSQLVADANAASTPGFFCLPHMELSSDEVGPQVGSDLGDALCLGTTSANHMGAHFITNRIPGGSSGLLGFCDGLFSDVLEDFTDNIANIRAQGGLPIANHPSSDSFGWNSRAQTQGIEANGLHGVEIWNDAFTSGQGGNVASWVNWLLDGRILYAYSGSDTHDAAFDFGANHVITLGGAFDEAALLDGLRAGRVYISNGPSLILEVQLGGYSLLMGERHELPSNLVGETAQVKAHYDFGSDAGQITLFRGQVGDGGETILCQSGLLSGSGVFECDLPLASSGPRQWVRAYLESDQNPRVAYANPVFLEYGTDDPLTYCSPKVSDIGCVPAIASTGTPSMSLGSGFEISASQVAGSQNGLLIYGQAPQFNPFQGGTLCVAPPIVRTTIQGTGGAPATCEGTMSFDFNQFIASGFDGSIQAGSTLYAQYWFRDPQTAFPTGLTDALQFTVQP